MKQSCICDIIIYRFLVCDMLKNRCSNDTGIKVDILLLEKGEIFMDSYNYTYAIPDNLLQSFTRFLELNGKKELAQLFYSCKLCYEKLGYAYYAGMRGNNWNKIALDFTIEGAESNINKMKPFRRIIADMLQKFLKPETSGYLVRNIYYNINETGFEVSLPEQKGDDFDILSRDIYDALAKDEPVLVLDRLHTFSMKYLREICQKHNIQVAAPNGQLHPLHNLVGSLVKRYEQNGTFSSDFSKKAMKMSISLFESYNSIRNDKSFAHDNDLLNKREATYVVKILMDTLSFIDEIENG